MTVQPDHTDRGQAGSGTLDFANRWDRVSDLRFLIDAMGTIESAIGRADLRLDPDRIGAAGHLYGADTVQLMLGLKVFSPQGGEPRQVKDGRVKAAVLMSAQGRGQGLTEHSWTDLTAPSSLPPARRPRAGGPPTTPAGVRSPSSTVRRKTSTSSLWTA